MISSPMKRKGVSRFNESLKELPQKRQIKRNGLYFPINAETSTDEPKTEQEFVTEDATTPEQRFSAPCQFRSGLTEVENNFFYEALRESISSFIKKIPTLLISKRSSLVNKREDHTGSSLINGYFPQAFGWCIIKQGDEDKYLFSGYPHHRKQCLLYSAIPRSKISIKIVQNTTYRSQYMAILCLPPFTRNLGQFDDVESAKSFLLDILRITEDFLISLFTNKSDINEWLKPRKRKTLANKPTNTSDNYLRSMILRQLKCLQSERLMKQYPLPRKVSKNLNLISLGYETIEGYQDRQFYPAGYSCISTHLQGFSGAEFSCSTALVSDEFVFKIKTSLQDDQSFECIGKRIEGVWLSTLQTLISMDVLSQSFLPVAVSNKIDGHKIFGFRNKDILARIDILQNSVDTAANSSEIHPTRKLEFKARSCRFGIVGGSFI